MWQNNGAQNIGVYSIDLLTAWLFVVGNDKAMIRVFPAA